LEAVLDSTSKYVSPGRMSCSISAAIEIPSSTRRPEAEGGPGMPCLMWSYQPSSRLPLPRRGNEERVDATWFASRIRRENGPRRRRERSQQRHHEAIARPAAEAIFGCHLAGLVRSCTEAKAEHPGAPRLPFWQLTHGLAPSTVLLLMLHTSETRFIEKVKAQDIAL